MQVKKGASIEGMRSEARRAIEEVDKVYVSSGIMLIITSGTEGESGDGVHRKDSKHYTGDAFDCRTRNIPGSRRATKDIYNIIRRVLGDDFDVVLEKDHIHVEYDPKTKAGVVVRTVKRAMTAQHDAVSLIHLIGGAIKAITPFYSKIKALLDKWFK